MNLRNRKQLFILLCAGLLVGSMALLNAAFYSGSESQGRGSNDSPDTVAQIEQAFLDGDCMVCMRLGIDAMRDWLKSRGDNHEACESAQRVMLQAVTRHIEPLTGGDRVRAAAPLMGFLDQQHNLGYELFQSGDRGREIAAQYAKLRGRLCQLMGLRERAEAEFAACLDVIGIEDAEVEYWRAQLTKGRE